MVKKPEGTPEPPRAGAESPPSLDRRDLATLSSAEVRTLIHELRVRQLELEFQNGGLRLNQERLRASRARCSTGLKRVELDTTVLATQLHRARKLATLGVLAAGTAHDVDNQLEAILGSARAGSLLAKGNAPVARFFGTIEAAAMRAKEPTRQLLAYAGKAKGTMEDVDLDRVVRELGQTLATCLPEHLTFRMDLADDLPHWQGDAAQAYQILVNLALNAYEAFPEGVPGEITLRTRAEETSPCAGGPGTWVLSMAPGRYVMLEVVDSGHGMTPDHLTHAFEPFFTTKAAGRGLGLAAVHGLLDGDGGGIWIRSGPAQGTSVKVYLPAMTGPAHVTGRKS
ncbi:sensor histidine kinase [Geothrix sp. 21YS21S-2]|uniref:sensor histidine kinase n=1 Tax=Geothrix sp. 21YS21S-2 TaxID=3068893 RepID=UPI0027B9022D|nr:ATP-binding protein [Geothrix sp. 21YS21S-2]